MILEHQLFLDPSITFISSNAIFEPNGIDRQKSDSTSVKIQTITQRPREREKALTCWILNFHFSWKIHSPPIYIKSINLNFAHSVTLLTSTALRDGRCLYHMLTKWLQKRHFDNEFPGRGLNDQLLRKRKRIFHLKLSTFFVLFLCFIQYPSFFSRFEKYKHLYESFFFLHEIWNEKVTE